MTRSEQISELKRKIKNCRRNANRQRSRQIDARGTRRDIRVRPEFWEQAEREYLTQLRKVTSKF